MTSVFLQVFIYAIILLELGLFAPTTKYPSTGILIIIILFIFLVLIGIAENVRISGIPPSVLSVLKHGFAPLLLVLPILGFLYKVYIDYYNVYKNTGQQIAQVESLNYAVVFILLAQSYLLYSIVSNFSENNSNGFKRNIGLLLILGILNGAISVFEYITVTKLVTDG